MGDRYCLEIDLTKLAQKLGVLEGHSISESETIDWLKEQGFDWIDEHWEAELSDTSMLEAPEVLRMWAAEDSGEGQEGYYPATFANDSAFGVQPFTLSRARRRQLEAIPEYEACVIPEFLVGSPREVMTKWRKMAKQIAREQSIELAMAGTRYVHVDDAIGWFILPRFGSITNSEKNIMIYPIIDELDSICQECYPGLKQWYEVDLKLFLEGFDSFWFTLCAMVKTGPLLPKMGEGGEIREREACLRMLRSILRWWPHICARDDRFVSATGRLVPWPRWKPNGQILDLVQFPGGLKRLIGGSCENAGRDLEAWLNQVGRDT